MSTDLQGLASVPPTHWLPEPLGWRQIAARPGLWLVGQQPIQLGEGFGSPAQRLRTERRIAFWRSLCGCQLAALAFLGAIAWQLWLRLAGQPVDGWVMARWLGMALLTAMLVKFTAVALARAATALELWWPRRVGPASESCASCEQQA